MSKPRHFLILPDDKAAALEVPARQKLTFTTNHPASSYGLGVLLDSEGEVFDGATFRIWRDTFGARIETDQPEKVCQALGVPIGEAGIVRITE